MLDTFLFAREKLLSSLLFQNVFLLLYTILLLLQFLMKPTRRVRFLRCFGLKTYTDFHHFGLEPGMIFERSDGSVT